VAWNMHLSCRSMQQSRGTAQSGDQRRRSERLRRRTRERYRSTRLCASWDWVRQLLDWCIRVQLVRPTDFDGDTNGNTQCNIHADSDGVLHAGPD